MGRGKIGLLFIGVSLLALIVGLFFGVIGAFQYVMPDFLKEYLSFTKTRPLHVTLVITWIFTAATGGIYYYLPGIFKRNLFSSRLSALQLWLLVLTGSAIIVCYFMGVFGGREYLEFPPVLALPMLITWIIFIINFFMTIDKKPNEWPVYIWMWSTGLIFFLLTFGEAYLWTIPFFGHNMVRDVTVQWKAMGSMVGSWNMLVYGTGFYVMEKLSGDKEIAYSKTTFFFYFLGLTNLMFNWGHHTYIVPAASWVKNVSYIISMTELLILGNIIRNWQRSVTVYKKHYHLIPYRFIAAADIWIFLNLILAIIISIPAINYYTHGTHITVAHAMGATIGINTMLLMASVFYITEQQLFSFNVKVIRYGFWVTNISLFIFWLSLIGSGVVKATSQVKDTVFQEMMLQLSPWFHAFISAGVGIFLGIVLITYQLIPCFLNINLSTKKMLLKDSI